MLPQFRVVAPQSNQCPTIPRVDATMQLQLRIFNVHSYGALAQYKYEIIFYEYSIYANIVNITNIFRYENLALYGMLTSIDNTCIKITWFSGKQNGNF